MSWKQKLLKLRHTSADELRVRLREYRRQQYERKLYESGVVDRGHVATPGRQVAIRAAGLVPGTEPAALTALREHHAEFHSQLKSQAVRRAEAILAGKWESLGFCFDVSNGVDWHFDPRSDFRWPRGFYADVPVYSSHVDVKYVWELGRQQYAVELAQGWLLGGRGEFAEHARDVMLSWISHNPLYEGVHWASALELAMRSISWIWTLATLHTWDGWSAGELQTIADSLADHAEHLEHHLSLYSSPYNHLVGEATALLLIALVLPECDSADRWRDRARSVLEVHAPRQFHADGFSVEQATGYHFYTLGFLSMAITAGRLMGEPPMSLEPIVHRAYSAGAAFRQPDGRWPAIGDVDSARSIPVAHEEFFDFNSLCAVGACLFNDGELKSTGFSEEAYWLLGAEAAKTLDALPERCLSRNLSLSESGYWIAAEADDWLLLDAGPIADGLYADATPSVAHGHADVLGVVYCHKRRPVLVDSGMLYYSGDSEWIGHFRSPAAHNCIQIEGLEVARDAGSLAWSHVRFECEVNGSSGAGHEARGHLRYPNDATIERHVLMLPGIGMWIADRVDLDQPRPICWTWQIPQGEIESGTEPIIARSKSIVLAAWTTSTTHTASIVHAQPDSPVASISKGYGQLAPGSCVREEICDTAHVLKVTFIGTELTPFQLSIGEAVLSHGWDDSLDGVVEVASGSATWRVSPKSNQLAKSVC